MKKLKSIKIADQGWVQIFKKERDEKSQKTFHKSKQIKMCSRLIASAVSLEQQCWEHQCELCQVDNCVILGPQWGGREELGKGMKPSRFVGMFFTEELVQSCFIIEGSYLSLFFVYIFK